MSDLNRDVAKILTRLDHMERDLYGNGQPGRIKEIEQAIEEIRDAVRVLDTDRVMQKKVLFAWVGGALFIFNFLTGSGQITLKALLSWAAEGPK